MLPLFAPWALLPWDVAWFVWRGGTILLLLWTIHWAYRRRPLATAILVALLGFPFGANLDTGNINLLLTLMLWGAQFSGPATGRRPVGARDLDEVGPGRAPRWSCRRGRGCWGLLFLAVSVLLSLATLPLTIVQLQALFGFGRAAPPARLPRLPVGARAGALEARRAVRLAPSAVVARAPGEIRQRVADRDRSARAAARYARARRRRSRRRPRDRLTRLASQPAPSRARAGRARRAGAQITATT